MAVSAFLEGLLNPSSPWIQELEVPDVLRSEEVEVNSPKGVNVVVVDATRMPTSLKLFDVLGDKLNFPGYFGRNWPAFDECMADLYEFLSATRIVLIIFNSSQLLCEEFGELETLLRILKKASAELSEPISLGESWDRPSVTLRCVFDAGINLASHRGSGVD